MATNRIIRIVVGLALIGYGFYSGIAWFYLGVLPLVTGIINWCPLEMKMGTCDPASGCCASDTKATDSSACCSSDSQESGTNSCCSSEDQGASQSSCCTPKTDATTAPKNFASFKPIQPSKDDTTLIEILGTGCSKCVALEKVVNEVVQSLDGIYEVKKVSDIQEIMAYNVVSTPGLVINGTVVSTGKLLSTNEVLKLLSN